METINTMLTHDGLPAILDRTSKVIDLANELRVSSNIVSFVGNTYFNPSADLPYHNKQHAFSTALRADILAKHYDSTMRERQIIFIASMFHDFNYSLEAETDRQNIRRAVEGFKKYCSEMSINGGIITPTFAQYIINVIQSTEYPRDKSKKPSFMQSIVQDADLLQSCEVDAEAMIQRLEAEGEYKGLSIDFPPLDELNTKFAQEKRQQATRYQQKTSANN